MLFGLYSQGHCLLFGLDSIFKSEKKHIEKVKNKDVHTDLKARITGISKLNSNIDLAALKLKVDKLNMQIDSLLKINNEMNNRVTGIDKTVSAGRDTITKYGDGKYILIAVLSIFTVLGIFFSIFIILYFKYQKWKLLHSEREQERNKIKQSKENYKSKCDSLTEYITNLEKQKAEYEAQIKKGRKK
jgi:Tfp pilus assembly protein PilO